MTVAVVLKNSYNNSYLVMILPGPYTWCENCFYELNILFYSNLNGV
jgi:hypothetical protein